MKAFGTKRNFIDRQFTATSLWGRPAKSKKAILRGQRGCARMAAKQELRQTIAAL